MFIFLTNGPCITSSLFISPIWAPQAIWCLVLDLVTISFISVWQAWTIKSQTIPSTGRAVSLAVAAESMGSFCLKWFQAELLHHSTPNMDSVYWNAEGDWLKCSPVDIFSFPSTLTASDMFWQSCQVMAVSHYIVFSFMVTQEQHGSCMAQIVFSMMMKSLKAARCQVRDAAKVCVV